MSWLHFVVGLIDSNIYKLMEALVQLGKQAKQVKQMVDR